MKRAPIGALIGDLIALGLWSGKFPVAPGTAGSVVGLLLFVAVAWFSGPIGCWVGFGVVTVAGFMTADGAARRLGKKDPGPVVIDEIAGQFLALLALPLTLPILIGGFALFRLFDITKPPPARQLERLPGSAGIMCDDLIAGLFANLVLQLLLWAFPSFWGGWSVV